MRYPKSGLIPTRIFSAMILLVAVTVLMPPTKAMADDHDEMSSKGSLHGEGDTAPNRPGLVDYINHYEYGLDLRATSIIDETTPFLHAVWNKRYWWGTYFGLALGGPPEGITKKEEGVTTRAAMYYGGLNIEQTIFRSGPHFRLQAALMAGKGRAFFRAESAALSEEVFSKFDFTIVEPSIFATFYTNWGITFGVSYSLRTIISDDDEVDESDVDGSSFGLIFRTGN